jgi:tripartite-type tricarboxylate transporter receptor subunit TctC
MSASIAHIRSGKVRALAVTNPQRNSLIPDVPTIAETLPGFAVTSWYGMIAPAGTPPSVVELMNRETGKVLFAPAVKEKLVAIGLEPVGGSSQAFTAFIASEMQKWSKVARDAGIKPE